MIINGIKFKSKLFADYLRTQYINPDHWRIQYDATKKIAIANFIGSKLAIKNFEPSTQFIITIINHDSIAITFTLNNKIVGYDQITLNSKTFATIDKQFAQWIIFDKLFKSIESSLIESGVI